MREIVSGVLHWTAFHDGIGIDVDSYFLAPLGVLLDPMTPPGGVEALRSHARPRTILLTNRQHYRHSDRFVEAFRCRVRAPRAGMHEFSAGEPVEPYDPGDELPGRVVAHEVGALCPDECVLHHAGLRVLACADGLFRGDDGVAPLGFVPDEYMGDDPAAVKRGLVASYERLATELEFDHLLLAHGRPIIDDGREALRAFVEEQQRRAGFPNPTVGEAKRLAAAAAEEFVPKATRSRATGASPEEAADGECQGDEPRRPRVSIEDGRP